MSPVLQQERYAGSYTLMIASAGSRKELEQSSGTLQSLEVANIFGVAEQPNHLSYWAITGIYIPVVILATYKSTPKTTRHQATLELLVGNEPVWIQSERAEGEGVLSENIRYNTFYFRETLSQPIPVRQGQSLGIRVRYSFFGYTETGTVINTTYTAATISEELFSFLEVVSNVGLLRYDVYKTSGITEL